MSKFIVLSSLIAGQCFAEGIVDSPTKMEPVPKAGEEVENEGEEATDQNKEAEQLKKEIAKMQMEELGGNGVLQSHEDDSKQSGEEDEDNKPSSTEVPPSNAPSAEAPDSTLPDQQEAKVRQAVISPRGDLSRREDHGLKEKQRQGSKSAGSALNMEAVQLHALEKKVDDVVQENKKLHTEVDQLARKVHIFQQQKENEHWKPAAKQLTNIIEQSVNDTYHNADVIEGDNQVEIKDVDYQKVADFVANFISMPALNKPDENGDFTAMADFRDASAQWKKEALAQLFKRMKQIRERNGSARFLNDSMLRAVIAVMPQKVNEMVEKNEEDQNKSFRFLAKQLGEEKKDEQSSGPEPSSSESEGLRSAVN